MKTHSLLRTPRLPWKILLSSLAACSGVRSAEIVTQTSAAPIGSGMGNTAPFVAAVVPPEEGFRTVLVELRAADADQDVISLRVEYDVLGDAPDRGWQLARALQDERTQELGLRDVRMEREEIPLAFFWDTDSDLPDQEARVRLRFTPVDGAAAGAALESSAFMVDND